jgi:hypothetical protein
MQAMETAMAVEDHVYEAAVRGRREFRQAYREARAARGEDRTLSAIHARADLRFLLACLSEMQEATGESLDPDDEAIVAAIRADLATYDIDAAPPSQAPGDPTHD